MKKVALGMSGGIDSTMSALLLMEQGYEVIGLTMSIWDGSIPIIEATKSGCFGPGEAEDLIAAKEACLKLGIEHHVIPLQGEYKDNVLDYFCSTYLDGKTPNPCVVCNQRMKFGFLPQRARQMGLEFDFFATGHYVRSGYNEQTGRWEIRKAVDKTKDQSYFLAFLLQEQIASTLFPLGGMKKSELRKYAIDHGFEYLTLKKESQDFLETDDYSVLFEKDTFHSGEIIDHNGKVVGTHKGLINYTIGQRKNIGISGMAEPYYVIAIDTANNRLYVGPQELLFHDHLTADKLNWVALSGLDQQRQAEAKIRLAHEAAPCIMTPLHDGRIEVVFNEPQLSITPGQAVVFYDGDILLGGGIII
jgi:tRNA-uridine 2-sulfurtransferase